MKSRRVCAAAVGLLAVWTIVATCQAEELHAPGVPAPGDTAPGDRAPVGVNLAGVSDWSSEIVFVDAFRAARAWISQAEGKPWGQGGPLELDSLGHVLRLADGQYAETILFTGFEHRFPAGTFTCLYDGRGELAFTGDARVVDRRPGKLLVQIAPRDGQATCQLRRTDPADPLRNIRLIMPGFETTFDSQPFHPEFLRRWRGFRALRFMDWGATNNSPIRQWSERPTPQHHSQAIAGVSLELMIALANELRADPWFCIPHLASDDYAQNFARLVHERLDPALKAYVEYSNECWNGQFEQARHCLRQGRALGLSDNDFEAQLRYYALRSGELFRIWEEEFADDRRLVRVLSAQSANVWTGETVLDFASSRGTPVDAIAIAPYFGHRWGAPQQAEATAAMPLDELMQALEDDVRESRRQMESYAALARRRGVLLLAYEGGQHLVGHGGAENNQRLTALLQSANRDRRMKDLYLQNLGDWQASGGGLFCLFSSVGLYSKWGSWGLLEHAGQDPPTAPKWEAVRAYLNMPLAPE